MTLNTVQIASIAQAIYDFAILYLLKKYIVNMKQNEPEFKYVSTLQQIENAAYTSMCGI